MGRALRHNGFMSPDTLDTTSGGLSRKTFVCLYGIIGVWETSNVYKFDFFRETSLIQLNNRGGADDDCDDIVIRRDSLEDVGRKDGLCIVIC